MHSLDRRQASGSADSFFSENCLHELTQSSSINDLSTRYETLSLRLGADKLSILALGKHFRQEIVLSVEECDGSVVTDTSRRLGAR